MSKHHIERLESRRLLATSLTFNGSQAIVPGANVRVSNDVTQQSEMSVAINPANPLNIVAFAHRIGAGATMASYYTFDGGNTWTAKIIDNAVDGINGTFRFDPTCAFDAQGRFYLGYGVDPSGGTRQLVVLRSLDGGASYAGVSSIATAATLDKWTINTGRDPVNPGQQNVYMAYRVTGGGATSVRLAASFDGGITWPTNTLVPDDAQAGSDFSSFGMPAVGPNGELYVVWEDYDLQPANGQIKVAFSSNAGATFAADKLISLTPVTRGNANGFPSNARYHISAQPDRGILAVPTIAVDRSDGPFRGRVYCAYTTRGAGATDNTDVVVRFSNDNGATWSAATVVHSIATSSSQFLPWLDVDSRSGGVSVAYYDTRNSGTNQLAELWVSSSVNGGGAWSEARFATAPSNQSLSNPSRYLGNYLEYIGVGMLDGTIHAVWADNRDAPGNLELYTARGSLDSATNNNVLTITGPASGTNTIAVQRSSINNAFIEVIVNGTREYTGLLASVDQIIVNGGDGDDEIFLWGVGTNAAPVIVNTLGGVDSLEVNSGGFLPAQAASINVTDRIDLIYIGVNTTLVVPAGGDKVITTTANVTVSGRFDLNDNDLIIDYTGATPYASVQHSIAVARAGGAWNGPGFTSSAAKNVNPKNTTLGLMEASDFKLLYGPDAPFSGQPIDATAVLVKYTYYGDTDFNGEVNFDDYSRTDAGFNKGRTGWLNGDFDGNGSVNFDDYSLIDLAFNTHTGTLDARLAAPARRLGAVR